MQYISKFGIFESLGEGTGITKFSLNITDCVARVPGF